MDRKQLIMEKAIELFAKQGIAATSVQQITEHCGISKGAFYLTFPSKDELVRAIITNFSKEMIIEIDRLVKSRQNPQEKLYDLYFTFFKLFEDHSEFAFVFIKEQLHMLNEELFNEIHEYNIVMNQLIVQLLDELYGRNIEKTKYDLLVMIKGFIEVYAHIVMTMKKPLNLELLCKTLVEKTNILANYSTIAFLNKGMMQWFREDHIGSITLDKIYAEISVLNDALEDALEKESLILLKKELERKQPSRAIIRGMLENLKTNEQCHWLCFLVYQYVFKPDVY